MRKFILILSIVLVIAISGCMQTKKFSQLTNDDVGIISADWESHEGCSLVQQKCDVWEQEGWRESSCGSVKFKVNIPIDVLANVNNPDVNCQVYMDGKEDDEQGVVLEKSSYDYNLDVADPFKEHIIKVCCRGSWTTAEEYTFNACQSTILEKLC